MSNIYAVILTCAVVTVSGVPLDPRIINGTKSHETWVAELVVPDNGQLQHHCGGSLVHPLWVVTAAHCFFSTSGDLHQPFKIVKVLFGSTKATEGEMFEIDKVFGHDFIDTEDVVDNDIALVKLSRPVSAVITKPVRLPEPGDEFDGATGIALGWGKTVDEENSPDLLQGNVYIGEKKECSKSAPTYHNERKICSFADQTGSTICSGDSGGPLAIHTEDGDFVFIGVTSYGDCTSYATFTKVAHYVEWILSYTQNS